MATFTNEVTIDETLDRFLADKRGSLLAGSKKPLTQSAVRSRHMSAEINGLPPAEPAGAAQSLVADELAKLAQLRDSGVLTEAEFVDLKARLLS